VAPDTQSTLDISVIIATYNRAKVLAATLRSLWAMDTTGLRWELLVVDNNSSDDTAKVAQAWQERLPLRYLFEPRQGQNRARNAALAVAGGGLITMTDDDVTPCQAWLKELWAAAGRWPQHGVFCGPVLTAIPPAFEGTLAGAVPTCNFVFAGGEGVLPADIMPISANFAIRRRAYAGFKTRLFDPTIGPRGARRISGSETVAMKALMAAGHRIVYVPGAPVLHKTPEGFHSIAGLCRRAFAQGCGDVRVVRFGEEYPRVFGVPRFVLRMLAEDFAGMILATAAGQRREALHKLFHALRFLGIYREWRREWRMTAPSRGQEWSARSEETQRNEE